MPCSTRHNACHASGVRFLGELGSEGPLRMSKMWLELSGGKSNIWFEPIDIPQQTLKVIKGGEVLCADNYLLSVDLMRKEFKA